MRVKGAANWPAQLARYVGQYQSYGHPKYGLIVTKWPRKRGPAKTPDAADNQATFAQVVAWAKQPMSAEIEAAQIGTKASGYLLRDVIESAAYGMVVTAYLKDGRVLRGKRMASADIQALLDTISSDVGAILVRGPTGWVGLDAGDEEQILTSRGALTTPIWADNSGGGGGGNPLICIGGNPLNSGSSASNQAVWWPTTVARTGTVSEMVITIESTTTSSVILGIYADSGSGKPAALLATTAAQSGLVAGPNFVPLVTPLDVTVGTQLWVAGINSTGITSIGPQVLGLNYQSQSFASGLPSDGSGSTFYNSVVNAFVGMLIA